MKKAKKRHAYITQHKLRVVNYAKKPGNGETKRQFGTPPTEKMIRGWRKQEDKLRSAEQRKHSLRRSRGKWPELEEEPKTWVVDQRNSGTAVSTKIIIFAARRIAAERGLDFLGT